jgi:hypothetical protein
MPPRIAERRIPRRVRHEMRHNALPYFSPFRPVRENGNHIGSDIAGIERRSPVQSVYFRHYFEQQSIFVCPVLIDGRFAYARSLRYGVHACGIDATLGQQFESGV